MEVRICAGKRIQQLRYFKKKKNKKIYGKISMIIVEILLCLEKKNNDFELLTVTSGLKKKKCFLPCSSYRSGKGVGSLPYTTRVEIIYFLDFSYISPHFLPLIMCRRKRCPRNDGRCI